MIYYIKKKNLIEKLIAKKYVAPPEPQRIQKLKKPPKIPREVSLEEEIIESKVSTPEKIEEKPLKKTKKQIAKEKTRFANEKKKAETATL